MLNRGKPTIFVGMSHSSHVEMWLKNFAKADRPIYFIESTNNEPNIRKILDNIVNINFISNSKLSYFEKKYINKRFPDREFQRKAEIVYQLKKIIGESESIVVHIMEFQHAGYLFCEIYKLLSLEEQNKIKIISTNYGSDIYWYKNSEYHTNKIIELLSITNVLISESERDKHLAIRLGYMNENIIVNSNAVGIPDEVFYKIIRNQEEQLREYIFVKGNFGFVGRPFAAIDLLCELSEIIKSHGLQIVIVSVPEEIRSIIKSQLEIFGLQHQIFGSGQLKRNEIFSLLSKSVVYLGFSLSDGLSTTAIEAMACGAIPFQTKSSTIFEWDSSMKCHMVDLNNMHVSKLDLADILENRKNNSEIITYNQNFIQKNFLASVVKKKVSQSIENMYD